MTRHEVLETCRSAHSRSEIEAALRVRARYLVEHPNDGAVLDMGEMLSKLLDALDLMGVDSIEPAPFPVVPDQQPAATSRP